MSYICILANGRGIAAAGDSRMTFYPVPVHMDRSRKVDVAPDQHLIWACCGLAVFGGVNYAALTSRILRRSQWTLAQKLAAICRRVTPVLKMQHRVSGKDAFFTLLLGVADREGVQVMSLDVINGAATLQRWPAPAIIDAGWQRELRPPLLDPNLFRNDTMEDLARRAQERVKWAIARDQALHKARQTHPQTVGGPVRWAVLGRPEEM